MHAGNNKVLTSPSGVPIDIRPIRVEELNRIPLQCWPGADGIERLFRCQETIGFAAWDRDTCVGVLHSYRFDLPGCEVAAQNSVYEQTPECWPLTCPLATAHNSSVAEAGLEPARPKPGPGF